APYMAEAIHRATTDAAGNTDVAANTLAHALLGAVVAQASGNNALAGAAGEAGGELAARALMEALYPGKKPSELNEEQKQYISTLATIAGGLAAGVVGNTGADAVQGAQSAQVAIENNAFAEIAEQRVSGESQADKYQKALKQIEAAKEEFKEKNCAGLSAEACSAKMDAHRDELLKGFADAGLDFVPVIGTIKTFAEAQSALDYLLAVATIVPGERIASGILKAAEKALKKGDIGEAAKLLNSARDEIAATSRPSHRQSEIDVGKDLGDGWREQVSFKDGKEVPYGTKGGVRPDWCQGNVCSVEVKNYNITTNQNGLINNVSKQAIQRAENLPAGMQQQVVIDVRGQTVSQAQERAIIKGIVEKSNGAIAPTSIRFKR
ncbi:VENN motif pre-toxin domain-containing protein, partial [Dickeya oryzae]